MQREIIRTINSLLPPYQQGVTHEDIEIIVIDNGSEKEVEFGELIQHIKFYKYPSPNQSPAAAVNYGLNKASSDLVGVFIDGARIASPGLCQEAIKVNRISERTVISTLAYHLGPDMQMITVFKGYNRQVEDELLNEIDWFNNGYDLFNVSTLAGSSVNGLFKPIAESNGLFMPKNLWNELNGFNERFIQPGGGLVNLDLYKRACELPNSELIMLISEATFHQVHGGIATNSKQGKYMKDFLDEYTQITDKVYSASNRLPQYYGGYKPEANQLLQYSIEKSSIDLNQGQIRAKLNKLFRSKSIDLSF